eukprot:8254307-Pyramimonas_sp.AAC.1
MTNGGTRKNNMTSSILHPGLQQQMTRRTRDPARARKETQATAASAVRDGIDLKTALPQARRTPRKATTTKGTAKASRTRTTARASIVAERAA